MPALMATDSPVTATSPAAAAKLRTATVKYKKYSNEADPTLGQKKLPSKLIQELAEPCTHADGWRPKPRIVELLNIRDYTHQVECAVDIDEPIFQPFPPEVTFHSYEAFHTYEAILYLRNNDKVARRVKVIQPDTPYLSVRRVKGSSKGETGKVALGMEVAYAITFRPETSDDYSYDLLVCTEREKFVVPIVATGRRAALDFPDLVQFGPTPAKSTSTQTFLVTNVGNKAATFALNAYEPFAVAPKRGHLGPGETLRCSVSFVPHCVGPHEGDLEIQYSGGELVYAALVGSGCEVDVALSQASVALVPTYVKKQSQSTFKIINNSNIAVRFKWKQHASQQDEFARATTRLTELSRATSRSPTRAGSADGSDDFLSESASGDSEDEERVLGGTAAKLAREYSMTQRNIDADEQLFGDDYFSIVPVEGSIWPQGEMEITVLFRPDHAKAYEATAFCEVEGRAERLPLQISGKGLGPQAVFSYDTLDVGEAYINTPHKYEVELMNRGAIEARYQLLPHDSVFGSKFQFEPESGVMEVGAVHTVKVRLLSDILGNFNEVFNWAIGGTSDPVRLQFRGRAVGPTFKVDVESVDFGVVSFGYRYTNELLLENTCAIPMRFNWRVPEDSSDPANREFQVVPASGSLLPMGKQKIQLEFVSRSVQRYDKHRLVLDVPCVGEELMALPVRAECVVPRIQLAPDFLDFGICYVRHPYKQTLRLHNDSKLPAKFEIMEQDVQSRGLANFTSQPAAGSIAAMASQEVEVELCTSRLGRIQLPLKVKVLGSRKAPLECIIGAVSAGASLVFGEDPASRVAKPEVVFGSVEVLKDTTVLLHAYNPSLIPACFKTFIEGRDSPFTVEPREGILQPADSLPLKLTINLDEVRAARDTLHVLVAEGEDIAVPLAATGTGQTVTCAEIADGLDFGHQFTGRKFSREVVVRNQGRRPVVLNWTNVAAEDIMKRKAKTAGTRKGSTAEAAAAGGLAEESEVFTITPARMEIPAKTACEVTISGASTRAGLLEERFVCSAGAGKAKQNVFNFCARVNVAAPALDFSQRKLEFRYSYAPGLSAERQTLPLTVRNISQLPLSFSLRAAAPFVIDRPSWQLEPQDAASVAVSFDPNFKTDLRSAMIKRKIAVVYGDNSQTDLDVTGEINFPNVEFDKAALEFGSVLTDTTPRRTLLMTNTSKVPVNYTWMFHEHAPDAGEAGLSETSRSTTKPGPAPASMFDILPISGCLPPGAAQRVEFSYYALPAQKAAAVAICEVEGGPTYSVPLSAESSSIKYSVEPGQLDVGLVPYDRMTEKEVVLQNQGRVPFLYKVNTSGLSRPDIVEVSPASGSVGPGQKETIRFRVTIGVPERMRETVVFEVAHFEPVAVSIAGEGVFPNIAFALPRVKDDVMAANLAQAQLNLGGSRSSSPMMKQAAKSHKAGSIAGSVSLTATGRFSSIDLAPHRLQLEAEADRLHLVQQLLAQRSALSAAAAAPGGASSPASPRPKGEPLSARSGGTTGSRPQSSAGTSLVVANYLLDFGYVIKGTNKMRKFKIANISSQNVNFLIDRKVLDKCGFTISPDRVAQMPGTTSLDFSTIDMAITLQTLRAGNKLGPISCVLPIPLKGGPVVHLTLKAHILSPDIRLSHETIDFGAVQAGHCKVMMVQLHNPREVAAEWVIKKPMEAGAAKDWPFFQCAPSEGVLAPGQRIFIKITFTPAVLRDATYSQRVPIRITNNKAGLAIQCQGSAYSLKLALEPAQLNLAAILPKTPGQKPSEATLRLVNPCDHPIEVFSVDWDKQYLADEERLRNAAGYDASDTMLREPLAPGAPLWGDLRPAVLPDAAAAMAPAATAASPTPPGPAASAKSRGPTPTPAPPVPPPQQPQPPAAPVVVTSPVEATADAEPAKAGPGEMYAVVLGPPLSGKTAQAALLAQRYGVPSASIDFLIQEAATLDESQAVSEGAPGPTLADEIYDKLIGNPVGAEEQVPPHTLVAEKELHALILRALQAALAQPAYEHGVVIDGLHSKYAAAPALAPLLLTALGLQRPADAPSAAWTGDKKVYTVNLAADSDIIVQRFRATLPPPASATISRRSSASPVDAEVATIMRTASLGGRSQSGPPDRAKTPTKPPMPTKPPTPAGGRRRSATPVDGKRRSSTAGDQPPEEEPVQQLRATLEQHAAQLAELKSAWTSPSDASTIMWRDVTAGSKPIDKLFLDVCGITFTNGVLSTVLPGVPGDADLIPDGYTLQVVRKPKARPPLAPVVGIHVLTPPQGAAEGTPAVKQTRWIIPAKQSVAVLVQFQSAEVGVFKQQLTFEVVGGQHSSLSVTAACDYPHINQDPKTVYVKRSRARPDTANISRQFVVSSGRYEFGPLLIGKDSTGYKEGAHLDNTGKLHITNNGLFDLQAVFVLKSADVPPVKGSAAKGGPPPPVFLFDPPAMTLKVGESADLTIFAFPRDLGEVQDTIVCRISDNPTPVEFTVCCVGAKPVVEIELAPDVLPPPALPAGGAASPAPSKTRSSGRLSPGPATGGGEGSGVAGQKAEGAEEGKAAKGNAAGKASAKPKAGSQAKDSMAGKDGKPEEAAVPEADASKAGGGGKAKVKGQAGKAEEVAVAAPSPPPSKRKAEDAKAAGEKGSAGKTAPGVQPAKAASPVPPAPNKIMVEGIVFERLLLGKKDSKTFIIHNRSVLPAKWKLAGAETLPPELKLSAASGEVPARGDASVTVDFSALEKKDLNEKLTLQILDAQGVLGVAQEIPIPVKGEAYKVEVELRFPEAGATALDFGVVKAVEDCRKTVMVANTGKYPVSFKVNIRTQALRELFHISPEEAVVPPGGQQALEVHFNSERSLQKEVSLAGNSDISLAIAEPLTGQKEQVLQMKVHLRAVYTKYSITPARGMNFGPLVYNTSSNPRSFDVSNLGEFPITVKLFHMGAGQTAQTAPAPGKENNLVLGPFSVSPATAVIQPGGKQAVTVVFKAEGAKTHVEQLGLDVTDRDPADNPGGISYEVAGESCIPGIDTEDIESIFEEHTILTRLDPFNPVNNAFARSERVFTYGAVVAAITAPEAGHPPAGVAANFKITNCVKVPTTINFGIKPAGGKADGAFPMTVSPAQIIIPPHESRYVTCTFAPAAIRTYSATFEAAVENGSDPKTKLFSCELRGEGTLPTLSVELPPLPSTDKGQPGLKFARMLKGKKATMAITLRNNGILDASARITMAPHAAFHLLGAASRLVTVESKRSMQVEVEFSPGEVKQHAHEVTIEVLQNPFERHRVAVTGECYMEDITFEGLPGEATDELRIPDCQLNSPVTIAFTLHNHSEKLYRVEWPPSVNLTFRPSAAHLLPGCSKSVTVTFQAEKALALKGSPVALKTSQVRYKSGEPTEWDNTIPEGASAADTEPAVEVVAGATKAESTAKDLPLKVFAVADDARFECDAGGITFKPTMMFQTRAFTFPLKNSGLGHLDFKWTLLLPDGTPDTSGLYKVSPEGGAIAAGETAIISVRFCPVEVDDCSRYLLADIPHLAEGLAPLARQLDGSVLRPWCHFELPLSDYVSSGRRGPEMRGPQGDLGPLDPATKVFELESLGVKVRNTRRFFVLNPTSLSYEFIWEAVGPPGMADGDDAPFTCTTRRGVVAAGKRYEMVFEFTPSTEQIQESFWKFCIPEQNLEVLFLLVGTVTEPRVFFDKPSLNFERVLVGGRARETVYLVNNEHLPFQFNLDKTTYDASEARLAITGKPPLVEFEPNSGTVLPNSRLALTATFMPTAEGSTNYNVTCHVKRKPGKLTLNVKGEGYAIHDSLEIESADGQVIELAANAPNHIDFGQVLINERAVRAVALVNSGSIKYDYVWSIGDNPRVLVKPESGSVGRGERVVCELCYNPHAPHTLDSYKVKCQVINGHTYAMVLSGVGHKPKLDFSFYTHDFGLCFLHQPGMQPREVILQARNDDKQEISFDLGYESSGALQVSCSATVLAPGETKDIPITFTPHEARAYHETLPFHINGLYTLNIIVKGEGSPLKIDLANPAQRLLSFGSVSRGATASRVLQVINRGRIPTALSFAPSLAMLQQHGIEVAVKGDVLLKPRATADITFVFKPAGRMRAFKDELVVGVAGISLPLAQLAGACLGTEVTVESDSIPFGSVVLGSTVSKRLQMENTGDVGTKYAWDSAALAPHFEIFPAEGFLAPAQDVKLDVTFHPRNVSRDIRVEKVRCKVEGGEDRFLTLTGACVESKAEAAAVEFRTAVRGTCQQMLTISNPSSSAWQVKPVVTNDFWSGPEFLSVPAGAKATYEVTYHPLAMTTPETPHEGSVFFPIPDGTGVLHQLRGFATAPAPADTIQRQLAAKAAHTETLRVMNWLPKPQRFRVLVDLKQAEPATRLTGPHYIDVPGLSEKEYKLAFFSYTEGATSATVTFKNETTNEYLFYVLTFTCGPPALRGTIPLQCPVRTRTAHTITLENPLDSAVVVSSSCENKQVVVPASVVLKPKAATDIEVAYRPLLVGESTVMLRLTSKELGSYEYSLKLKGALTGPERSLTFSVPLGSSETQTYRFMHWLGEKAEYKCAFRNKGAVGFECKPSVTPGPAGLDGLETEVEVTFEPTSVGENFRDVLVVSSATGGDYECPVVGRCIPPKPQGPIDMVKNAGSVPFKNIFSKPAEFMFTVDNPAFVVKPSEAIPAKKSINIGITFKEDPSKPKTGKLTVSCPSETSSPWVFYLRA